MVNSIQLLVTLTPCLAVFGQRCSLLCGPGETCAPVRYGQGPAVYDCITYAEALLLQQAYRGGPTGPGTGFGKSSGPAFTVPVDSLEGQRFPGFRSDSFPNQVPGPSGIWIDFRGLLPVGFGTSSSVGGGAFPGISANLPIDGVANPAGVSGRLRESPFTRNNTTNTVNNMNMQGAGNGTLANGETTGRLGPNCRPCQSALECGGGQCIFSPACGQPACIFLKT